MQSGEEKHCFLTSASREQKKSSQVGMQELWGRLLRPLEYSKSACFDDHWKQHTPVAAGLQPGRSRQCLHLSRGRRRRGKEGAAAKPQSSQQLLGGNGRRGTEGRWKRRGSANHGGRGGENGSYFPGKCLGWQGGSCALRAPPPASAHPPRKRAEPKPEARRPAEPAPPQSLRFRGRQVPLAKARVWQVGWVPSSSSPKRGRGRGAVVLTWLVWGGRDGHGSGGRGETGSPGKDRLFRRGAGESRRQGTYSPVSEAAPWMPTRSFSAAAEPPSHYPPPSSAVAAASTSSSAETPRPLHTLSHHAAGEPLPPIRHFRAQAAGSGLALVGAGVCEGGHSKGISVTERYPAQASSRRAPAAILGEGKLPFSLLPCECGRSADVLLHSAARWGRAPDRDRCVLACWC